MKQVPLSVIFLPKSQREGGGAVILHLRAKGGTRGRLILFHLRAKGGGGGRAQGEIYVPMLIILGPHYCCL